MRTALCALQYGVHILPQGARMFDPKLYLPSVTIDADHLNILALAGDINPFNPATDPRDLEDLQAYLIECLGYEDDPNRYEEGLWQLNCLSYMLTPHPLQAISPGNPWLHTIDGDPRAQAIFQRHYSARPNRTSKLFVGPGYKQVLITRPHDPHGQALFVWRLERFRRDNNYGANCAVFRNESTYKANDLILWAEEYARQRWPFIPRMFTHIDPAKTLVIKRRGKRVIGFAYQQAGWEIVGQTSRGLVTLAKLTSPLERLGDDWKPNDPDLTYRPEDYWPNRPNTHNEQDPTTGGTPHQRQRRTYDNQAKNSPKNRKTQSTKCRTDVQQLGMQLPLLPS